MKIKPSHIIGLTKSPDGHYYLNLKNFRQVEVTAAEWHNMRKAKLQ